MKRHLISLTLFPLALFFAGCGQEEESTAETAEADAVKAAEAASAEASEAETGQTANSLIAATEAVKKAVPELEKQAESMAGEDDVAAAMEDEAAEVEEVVVTETEIVAVSEEETVVATKEVAVMEVEPSEAAPAEAEGESLMSKAMDTAGGMVSQLDLSNLTWEKVSEVPYDDKAQLLAWATQQANTWKSKLTDAAMDEGTNLLNNLGDTGWQGALSKVMDALNGVREASPETWQMARGALVSAWDNFETQATAFLAKE